MTDALEEQNAALRAAVTERHQSAMAASIAGCPPAQAAAAAVLADTPSIPVDYILRAEAELKTSRAEGWKQVVKDAEPARMARAGTTAKFGTGAVRSDTFEQFRYDLVSPIGLREVARACAEGAAKYSDYNWERGMPVHDLLNHAIAHVYQYLAGDRGEAHLGHAAWNLLAAIHSEELWPHLNAGHLRGPRCEAPTG